MKGEETSKRIGCGFFEEFSLVFGRLATTEYGEGCAAKKIVKKRGLKA